jgi:diacylglycerol kinase (ATP)
MKNQPFHRRLGYAWRGLKAAWRTERNFRLQCGATGGVVLLLLGLRPPAVWWAILLVCCGAVLTAELFNSALERLLDHLHPTVHPAVALVKDLAAAAVLALSLASLAVFAAFLAAGPWPN